jgi:sulfur carrier protein ThiS
MVLFKLVKLSLKVIIIRQIADLLETGIIETITPEREMTVGDLLKELNLEGKYFGILVNGKKADEETVIDKDSSITILPHIAGG